MRGSCSIDDTPSPDRGTESSTTACACCSSACKQLCWLEQCHIATRQQETGEAPPGRAMIWGSRVALLPASRRSSDGGLFHARVPIVCSMALHETPDEEIKNHIYISRDGESRRRQRGEPCGQARARIALSTGRGCPSRVTARSRDLHNLFACWRRFGPAPTPRHSSPTRFGIPKVPAVSEMTDRRSMPPSKLFASHPRADRESRDRDLEAKNVPPCRRPRSRSRG
jgi:hypothetical protein